MANSRRKSKKTIPAPVPEAERFLAGLTEKNAGEKIWDSVETQLYLDVQKTVRSFRLRVRINDRWTNYTLGRLGPLTIGAARSKAEKIRTAQNSFHSMEQLEKTLAGTENHTISGPSLLICFEAGANDREGIKGDSIKRYRFALLASGSDFYNLSISLIRSADLQVIAKTFRRKKSRSYFGNFLAALSIAYEYAIDNTRSTGVITNLAHELRGLDYDVNDPEPTRNYLQWHEIRAFWRWLSDPRCPLTRTQIRLYRSMLLVGERIDSLRKAEWSDIGDDGWWVIPPHKRKMALVKKSAAQPVYIRMTEVLSAVLGHPDGRSPYIFASESDPSKPYPHGSEPLWNLFRVRKAINAGVTVPPLGSKITLPAPLSGSLKKSTAKRERNILRRYHNFLLPEEIPQICHHEAGRHTLATLAQELEIPGLFVSLMLGHATDRSLPSTAVPCLGAFSTVGEQEPPPMPRAFLRQANALASAGKTAKMHYTHIKTALRGIEAAWIIWTEAFCKNVIGDVPQSITTALQDLLGPEDQILALLRARFRGNLEAALQHLEQGHDRPTLHIIQRRDP